jgi:SH3-like domain-containing protein
MTEDSRLAVSTAAAVLGGAALFAGVLLLGRMELDRIPYAVVLPDTIAVKEGADSTFRTSFQVHAGLRLRVQGREQDWVRVRLANGLEGFVRSEDLGLL